MRFENRSETPNQNITNSFIHDEEHVDKRVCDEMIIWMRISLFYWLGQGHEWFDGGCLETRDWFEFDWGTVEMGREWNEVRGCEWEWRMFIQEVMRLICVIVIMISSTHTHKHKNKKINDVCVIEMRNEWLLFLSTTFHPLNQIHIFFNNFFSPFKETFLYF